MNLSDLPAIGQPLDGGIFAGVTTHEGTHCAVVLLHDKPDAELPWEKAMAWADGLQAALPTRPVAALLYATARHEFEREWYWTCEQFDGSYAWNQSFGYGTQYCDPKSYEGRARAVRLIPLEARNG